MSLYSLLLLGSVLVPLALSFDRKLRFYKQWKFLFPSIILVAFFYWPVDIYFTWIGIWGFNPRYHSPVNLLYLPLEEWLFFIAIPYASIFLHDSIGLYFSKYRLSAKLTGVLSVLLVLGSVVMIGFNLDKVYTVYAFSLIILVLVLTFMDKQPVLRLFYLTFLVILIPFVMVNAVLTGTFIEEPIVWYNDDENTGIRFLTIPMEDFSYAFSLILFNLWLRNRLKKGFGLGIFKEKLNPVGKDVKLK